VFKAVSACSLILCYLVYLSFLKKGNVLDARGQQKHQMPV
jgi:hypothetical protein